MIEFARAWAFIALPLPIAAWLLLPPLPLRAAVAVPPSIWRILEAVAAHDSRRPGLPDRLPVLPALGWLALVVALAGPIVRGEPLVRSNGRDMVLAVDVSASMAESDAGDGRRIDAVRAMLAEFVHGRHGDRIALIAFGSDAHLITPLTFDTAALAATLDEISIGLAGRRTDLGQAIGLTVKVLRAQPEAERVLILISDGETNLGDLAAIDAAALAAERGIRIHMIGSAAALDAANAAHMAEIAERTGGSFLRASDSMALDRVHDLLDRLAPVEAPSEPVHLMRDWTWLPLVSALVILAAIGWREARDP